MKWSGGVRVLARSLYLLLGTGVQRGAVLLLLPLLVLALTPEQFARYGLALSLFSILLPLSTMNLHLSAGRLSFDHEGETRRGFLTTIFLASAISSFACLALLVGALELFHVDDPLSRGNWGIRLLVGSVVIGSLSVQFTSLLSRISGRTFAFTLTMFAQGLLLFGIFVGGATLVPDPLVRVLLAHVISATSAGAIGLFVLRDSLGGAISLRHLPKALRFSWPTVIHLVALWTITYGGRWIGVSTIGLSALAGFTLLTQIVLGVGLLTRSLFDARVPEVGRAFAHGKVAEAKAYLKVPQLVALVLVLLGYAAAIVSTATGWLQLPSGYELTTDLVLLAALASLVEVFYLRASRILEGLKRTDLMAATTIVSCIASLSSAYVLVQFLKDTGLLIALLIGFCVQAVLSTYLASRVTGEEMSREILEALS